MAAGNFIPFNEFLYRAMRQEFDFLNTAVKTALLDNNYTPDVDAHDVIGDVSGNEIADADYARQTLANKTITEDANGRTVYDADNVDYGDAVSISARYQVVFLDTGSSSTSYLMGYIDLNDGGSTEVSSTNSDFDVSFNADGIYRVAP